MSKLRVKFLICMMLAFGASAFAAPILSTVYSDEGTIVAIAEDYGDDVDGNQGEDEKDGEKDSAFSNYAKNYVPMTDDQFEEANMWSRVFTGFAGYGIGVIVCIITAYIFFITALDLLYLSIPPIRRLLYKPGTDGTGAPMGGGMGSMGGYGGMRGGMGGGNPQTQSAKPTQWISDECVIVAAMLGGSAQAQPQGGMGGGMGGYGGGMGGYGGGMMGGQQQQQDPVSVKSAIGTYLKLRIKFLVLLAICLIVLLSSIFLGTGINLAQWFLGIMETVNSSIPN